MADELNRITLERVREAVEANGFPLLQGLYWNLDWKGSGARVGPVRRVATNFNCACALGHVYWHEVGKKEYGAVDMFGYKAATSRPSSMVRFGLGLSEEYQYGFIEGFDCPQRMIGDTDTPQFRVGFEDGKAVAEHYGFTSGTNEYPG